MNYNESIKLLTSSGVLQIKPGLERISAVLSYMKNPENRLKIIHIAGTNGKGSISAMLSNILKCSGYKTGLYTSPHLIEYTERIKINDREISKQDFADLVEYVCSAAEKNDIYLTEFEILTAAAFKYFADNNTDFAVIETGLGGRLDGTNVCSNPVLTVVSSVSLDHTGILGASIEDIAFEKAGIIKQGAPVIVSNSNKGYAVIKEQAEKKGAELITAEKEPDIIYKNGINYAVIDGRECEFPLKGVYQKQNLALAAAACRYLKEKGYSINLKEGLKTVQWRARLEYIKEKNLLVDGAHNPDAALELKKSLDFYYRGGKRIFIYGTINTKDYKTIAEILFEKNDEIYYYEFEHKNAVSFEEYKKNIPFLKNIQIFKPEILQRKELKIVTGSLYMAGDFMKKFIPLFL